MLPKWVENIENTITDHYFPDIWYLVESWLLLSNQFRRIVDIGCGSGLFAEGLAQKGAEVSCIDFSLDALRETQNRIGVTKKSISYEQCNLTALPFESGTFDGAVCVQVLPLHRQPDALLNEISRILRPGGRAVICGYRPFSFWLQKSVFEHLHVLPNQQNKLFPVSKRRFQQLLLESNFVIDSIRPRVGFLPFTIAGTKIPTWFGGNVYVAMVKKASDQNSSTKLEAVYTPTTEPLPKS